MSGPWEKYQDEEEQMVVPPQAIPTQPADPDASVRAPESVPEGPWTRYQDNTLAQNAMKDVSSMGVMLESTGRGLVDNLMNVPNAMGDVLGSGLPMLSAGIETGTQRLGEIAARTRFNMATGEPIEEPLTPMGESFSRNLAGARQSWPYPALRQGVNMPSSIDLQAGAQVAAQNLPTPAMTGQTGFVPQPQSQMPQGNNFSAIRDEMLEGYIQRREAYPAGADTGDILADVATLYMGRAPVVNFKRNQRLMEGMRPDVPLRQMNPGFRRWASETYEGVKDKFGKSFSEIGESGFEGAMLSALQDENPVVGTAVGVAGQTANNIAMHVWDEVDTVTGKAGLEKGLTRGAINASIIAAAGASLFQLVKSVTPGGKDFILESEESGYDKAAMAMVAGLMTTMAGYNRPTTRQLDDLNLIIDTWGSSRRGAVASLISEIANDDSGDSERIMNQLHQDPTYFDTTALRRINRAWRNEDVKMTDTIETLMESDRDFRRKVMALREQQQ